MVGNRIRELRKLKFITQEELAKSLGLKSQTTIAAIERNKNKPSSELLSKIADYFGVSTDFILGKTNKDIGYIRLLFASKLKEKRKNDNLTIEDISKELGIRELDLIGVENGKIDDSVIHSYYLPIAEYINLDKKYASDLALMADHIYLSIDNYDDEFIEEQPKAYNTKITDVKEALNVIMAQPGLMLNGEALSDESKIALANAINMGLAYAAQKQQEGKNKK